MDDFLAVRSSAPACYSIERFREPCFHIVTLKLACKLFKPFLCAHFAQVLKTVITKNRELFKIFRLVFSINISWGYTEYVIRAHKIL